MTRELKRWLGVGFAALVLFLPACGDEERTTTTNTTPGATTDTTDGGGGGGTGY